MNPLQVSAFRHPAKRMRLVNTSTLFLCEMSPRARANINHSHCPTSVWAKSTDAGGSFIAERHHWIDAHRPASRDVAREEGGSAQQRNDCGVC